jgi:type VI secretion system secreted protein Hcp
MNRLLLVCLALLLAALPSLAQNRNAPQIFASINGQKTGVLKGEVTQKGRDGLHQIVDFEYGIASPRDAASGMASGKRQHKPVRLLKKISAASPLLFQAMVNNENFPSIRLDFWEATRIGASSLGAEMLTQSITLQNARLASWRQFVHPELGLVEELQISFQRITISHKQGGIEAQDDWTAFN